MRILITGGAGFIGSHLAKLHAKTDDVYILDNLVTGSLSNVASLKDQSNVHIIEADTTTFDFSSLETMDLIYHLASPASPIQYKKYPVETLLANSYGTYRVLEFMAQSNSGKMVYTSTSEVYGDPLVHPQPESYWGNVNTVGPRSCYDEGKRFGESMCMSYIEKHDVDVRIARLFNTYGPFMEQNDGRVVSNFIVQAVQDKSLTIYGNGTQTRSFSYVDDTVNGLHLLITTPHLKGEVVNLGNPDERTVLELAHVVKKLTGTSAEIEFIPQYDTDDPKKRKPDITKAKKLLGWEPKTKLEDGLLKTIAYFKETV